MKRWIMILALALPVAGFQTGCEWTSGGGVDSWSDSYNWVNFSGVYRGKDGGILVTDYTITPGAAPTTNQIPSNYELIGTGVGSGATTYSGILGHSPVVAGTLLIVAGGFTFTDNGSGGLTGNIGGTSGTIAYQTGGWSLDLGGSVIGSGTPIYATYTYTKSGSGSSGGVSSGASGKAIYAFTVYQEGQQLKLVDSNGKVYTGQFGSIRSTGGVDEGDGTAAAVGDTVVGQFSVSGVSAANMNVTIAGTMQAVVEGGDNGSYLAGRQIFGTWIEENGRTGDVTGEASPISIQLPSTSSGSSSTTSSGTSTTSS